MMHTTRWLQGGRELFRGYGVRRRARRQLGVGIEALEGRQMLTTGLIAFDPGLQRVNIIGTSEADTALVFELDATQIAVQIQTGVDTQQETFLRDNLQSILFLGLAGDDSFRNDTDIPATAVGDAGNDDLQGGAASDLFYGGEGDDNLDGGAGSDTVLGGNGQDHLLGGLGNDLVHGGDADDFLDGGAGNDQLYGANGSDHLLGSGGDDYLHSGDGDDVVEGGDGNDRLFGGNGEDRLLGGFGEDFLHGGNDDDYVHGGGEDDTLYGGTGNDQLEGVDGNDLLVGGLGDELARGGAGNDVIDGGDGADRVFGDGGDDLLTGGGGNDELRGGSGDDRAFGGSGDDTVIGDGGNDVLHGDSGNDLLHGRSGDDLLRGGAGDDQLRGESDQDVLLGEGGVDLLFGGAGRDLSIGGTDADDVRGDGGEDIVIGGSTLYDGDDDALRQIVAVWASAADYEARIAALEDPQAAYRLQSEETVLDDGVQDVLFGRHDRDWFFMTGSAEGVGSDYPQFLQLLDDLRNVEKNEQVNSRVPHAGNPVMQREHFALFGLVDLDAVTHTAAQSGPWSAAATWAGGEVPGKVGNVLIPHGVTVTVDGEIDGTLRTVRVMGVLEFAPDRDTQLRVDTLVVDHHGAFVMGTEQAPIAAGVTARLVVADRGAIDRDWDPFGLSRGVVIHGRASIYGQETTPFIRLAGNAFAGATQLDLESIPINWRVGDEIVLAGTEGEGDQDEERQIVAIDGNRITVAPLAYNHVGPENGLFAHVAHLTRNAVIESENPHVDHRGHVMFMHTREVDVNFAGFYHLGRTDKLQLLNDSVVDDAGSLQPGTGTNQRGRYAVHFHRNGVRRDSAPAEVNGSVVLDSLGWGYVSHSSYVEFTNNVAYDVNGAAFVTEAGSEIGSFVGNIAIHSEGSDDGINERRTLQDFGHQGDGFWFQGPGVEVIGNVAAGQSGNGLVSFTQGLFQNGLGKEMFLAENLDDPSIAGGADSIEVGEAPILNFRGNESYANRIGADTRFHRLLETHATPSLIEDFVLWNNRTGLSMAYTHLVTLRNVQVIGDVDQPAGIGVNTSITRNTRYENLRVVGYREGVRMPLRGDNVLTGGFFNNTENLVIRTPVRPDRSIVITGGAQFGALSAAALGSRTQLQVAMRANLRPMPDGISHVVGSDLVLLDYGGFQMRQVYFLEQAASFVPYPAATQYLPSQYVGKTNQQLWNEFGIAVGGELAPAGSVELPGIRGLVAPQ